MTVPIRTVPPTLAPSNLTGLTVWYEGASVVLGGGGKVSQWTDLSGNGHHSTQPTTANQIPYEVAGMNGQPCLHSDGFGQLVFPDLHTLTAGHIFTVLQADLDPPIVLTDGELWLIGTGANAFYPFTDGNIYENAMTSVRKTVGGPHALQNPHIYEIISTSSEYTVKLDGVQIFTTGTNTFAMPSSPAFLFAETSITGANAKVRMAEFVLCNAKQAAATAAAFRTTYLGPKYGIATT